MIEFFVYGALFVGSLAALMQGSRLFLNNAERIGLAFGLPSFVIGVLVVGFGTSLPELASALSAVFAGSHEIVVANAIGSNIANIFLIGGVASIIGGSVWINRDLLDAELPFFVISTVLFLAVIFDSEVTFIESMMLVATFLVYLWYLFTSRDDSSRDVVVEDTQQELRKERKLLGNLPDGSVVTMFAVGLVLVIGGAKYLIDSVIVLGELFSIPPSIITMTAISFGTSVPELFVSIRAMYENKAEVALGNIFGSNAFNILFAVGIPGLFSQLPVGEVTYAVGMPILAVASLILLVIGLARKLYRWEGIMFLILYLFFILNLFSV